MKNTCTNKVYFRNHPAYLFEKKIKASNIIYPDETHIVPNITSPIRLQEYGVGIFMAALTKSALKKALKKRLITVNGIIATTATFINGGESITLSIPEEVPSKEKLVFPLKVIFEDEHLAVIHKPGGILVSGNSFKTIANALPQNIKRSNLSDATKPQPVHRLDYPTTGILLVGKTSSSIRALNRLFEDKEIKKTYYAATIGEMNDQGEIISAIDGKKSQSKYKLCASVPSNRFDRLNLVELKPQTGRRHQLRKHLSSIGHPILGDKEYGIENLILNGKGLYLHAYSLRFIHPFTNKEVFFKDELPQRFKKIFHS
ncbi:RluA family pseudouridine synthase [Neolewinella persica]|uniref:RluA family pseudouridine synthase n=1 Tax=Neolewinella persica TaxID=70998 RepID=UPI000368609D|nr:RluA family pseudouridine synthase [Neolewinella persica]